MRVLLTGASGLLGSYLVKTAPADAELFTERFDILDANASRKAFLDFQPDTIIHCAGEGRVDFAESNPAQVHEINVRGTRRLSLIADDYGCRFVYISSNAVFNGGDVGHYNEHSQRNPINQYGRTKLAAENVVSQYPYSYTIIRPILLYGWSSVGKRGNFVTRALEDLRDRVKVKVAKDIITQPTYAWDCAKAIWTALQGKAPQAEIINVAPRKKMSLYQFGVEIAKAFGYDPDLILPVLASEFPGLAPRPRDTTFDTAYMESKGIRLRNPAEGLLAMKAEKE